MFWPWFLGVLVLFWTIDRSNHDFFNSLDRFRYTLPSCVAASPVLGDQVTRHRSSELPFKGLLPKEYFNQNFSAVRLLYQSDFDVFGYMPE